MAFPLLKLLPGVLKTAARVLGLDVEGAVKAIVGEQLSPEQQVALQQALQQHEQQMRQMDVDAIKALVSESVAQAQSSDKWVSRARPTGLYLAYALTTFVIVSMPWIRWEVGAIMPLLVPFWGAGGYYMHLRTKEKVNGSAAH